MSAALRVVPDWRATSAPTVPVSRERTTTRMLITSIRHSCTGCPQTFETEEAAHRHADVRGHLVSTEHRTVTVHGPFSAVDRRIMETIA